MLEKVLHILAEGRLLAVDELAKKLNVTHPMVEAMLDDLERMGYLTSLQPACETRCAGCASEGICTIVGKAQIWSLSEKGRRALARQHSQEMGRAG